jgi:hypothetical protein
MEDTGEGASRHLSQKIFQRRGREGQPTDPPGISLQDFKPRAKIFKKYPHGFLVGFLVRVFFQALIDDLFHKEVGHMSGGLLRCHQLRGAKDLTRRKDRVGKT